MDLLRFSARVSACARLGLQSIFLASAGAMLLTGREALPQTDKSAISTSENAADRAAFEKVCGACHPTTMINSFRSEPDWRETVANMIENGAKGTNAEFESVMRILLRFWTKVNVNSATAEEIAPVLNVSDSVAKAVVKYRADHGDFKTLDDLKKVPGLPNANVENCKDRIVF